MKKILITAHSGCEGTPDNSMESIMKGIELGADCVEIDIRMDEAGALWLSHDPSDYSSAVPLEQVLSVIARNNIGINCDLKEERTLYPVLELAEKCGLKKECLIFSGSVNVSALVADASIARRARIFLNSEELYHYMANASGTREDHTAFIIENLPEIAELMKRLEVEALNAPYKHFTPEQIDAIRGEGIELSLWTVNEEDAQEQLMHKDLLNMTTRKVVSALQYRKEIRG